MSGEFGHESGRHFFHEHIRAAQEDCTDLGTFKLTSLYGEFLKDFYKVAVAISYAEASDSTEAPLILEAIKVNDRLLEKLTEIKKYLGSYELLIKYALEAKNDRSF